MHAALQKNMLTLCQTSRLKREMKQVDLEKQI